MRKSLAGKLTAFLIVTVMALALVAPTTLAAKKIRIGFSQYTQKAPFYVAQVEAAKAEAKRLGVELIVVDAQDNISKQISDVEDLIAKKVDVIVLNPKDPKALIPVTKAVNKAKIPLIIADSTIDPSVNYVTTIKSNNYVIGVMAGEVMAKKTRGRAKIAMISGSIGNIGGQDRRDGFVSGFMEESLRSFNKVSLEVVAQGWGGWTQEGGLKAMEDILVAHKEIDVVFGENDAMALGALKAIKEAKREGVLIAGIDGQKEALAMIKEGGDYVTTGLNSPKLLGEMTIQVALKVLKHEAVPQVIYTPADAIVKDNVSKYYSANLVF